MTLAKLHLTVIENTFRELRNMQGPRFAYLLTVRRRNHAASVRLSA